MQRIRHLSGRLQHLRKMLILLRKFQQLWVMTLVKCPIVAKITKFAHIHPQCSPDPPGQGVEEGAFIPPLVL